MPGLGARYVAHMVLEGPDTIASTNITEMAKAFRRDTALTIARGRFGDALTGNANDQMQTALSEWQEGRRVAASSIGIRINRVA